MNEHSTNDDVSADDDEAAQRSYLRWLRLRFLKRYARGRKKSKADKGDGVKVENEQPNTLDRSSD